MIKRFKKWLVLRWLKYLDLDDLNEYVKDRQMREFFDSAYGFMVNKTLELYKDEKNE